MPSSYIIISIMKAFSLGLLTCTMQKKKKNGAEQGLGMKLYGTTHSFVGSSCSTLHFLTWYTSKAPVQDSKASFLAWRWFTLVRGRKSKELLTQSIACCLSLWSIVWTSGVYIHLTTITLSTVFKRVPLALAACNCKLVSCPDPACSLGMRSYSSYNEPKLNHVTLLMVHIQN